MIGPRLPLLRGWLAALLLLLVCQAALPEEDLPFSAEERNHWAFRPLRRPEVPRVKNTAWVKNPVDAFILARLEPLGITPAPEADRRTLIRRLKFDLLGLPPTPEEVEQFVHDTRPDAYRRLVDRLLASPHFGERWARHWLDVVRFAESDGYRQDAFRPWAWRYRDWVIRSFNQDKPFDRFVQEQVAGDELFPNDPEALVATGFLRHWPYEFNQRDAVQQRRHILNDLTDTTAQVFLGLTMKCARCHDHKFDPLLQDDYYRFQAFFAPLVDRDAPWPDAQAEQRYRRRLAQWRKEHQELDREIEQLRQEATRRFRKQQLALFSPELQAIAQKPPGQRTPWEQSLAWLVEKQLVPSTPEEVAKCLKGPEKKRWQQLCRMRQEAAPPELERVMTVAEIAPEPPPTFIPDGGDPELTATHYDPGFPLVLGAPEPQIRPTARTTGRRAALARWLTNPQNPLVARVIVNRLWHYHFRRGIVATPNDFGRRGSPPTHPKLLDWLASELIRSGWSLKHIHRLIVTSAAYRQQSQVPPSAAARKHDPDNRLLWRQRAWRVEAEVVRDTILAVTGRLNPQLGGPSVWPKLPKALAAHPLWKAMDSPEQQRRRSIYLVVKRNDRLPLLEVFDLPQASESCARRLVTTTAPQALLLLNGPWTLEQARAWASRLQAQAPGDLAQQVRQAVREAYGRPPRQEELQLALGFLRQQQRLLAQSAAAEAKSGPHDARPAEPAGAEFAALVDFCHVLLNSNELIFVD